MKPLRFRIAWVMVAVAIAALDFGALRAVLSYPEVGLVGLGALPMANVLVIGNLVGQHRQGSRPFLLGFEAFGAMALTLFFGLVIRFPREVVMPYLEAFLSPVATIIGQHRPFVLIPIHCVVAVVLLGWPQLAFALLGGFLSRSSSLADDTLL